MRAASLRMAVFIGLFLPLAETVRRSNQLLDPARFLNWFDDYLLGGFVLWAAYRVKCGRPRAIYWLIAAWGAGAGALALSFIGQLTAAEQGIVNGTAVLAVKGLILAYMCAGLYLAVQSADAG